MEQLQLPFIEEFGRKVIKYGIVYPDLERALLEDVKENLDEDAFKPVIIVVPSSLLGAYLSLKIRGGGVYFYNFRQIAERVSGGYFLEKEMSPVPFQGEETLARQAIERIIRPENPFYRYSKNQGFLTVFMSLLKDFRQGNFDSFPDIPGLVNRIQVECARTGEKIDPVRLDIVFNLLQEFRKGFRRKYFDIEDSIIQASKSASSFRKTMNTNRLILYGFYDYDEAQKKLIGELAKYINITVFLPYRKQNKISIQNLDWFINRSFSLKHIRIKARDENSSDLDRLKSRFFYDEKINGECKKDNSVGIISCPDHYAEAREISRKILQLAREDNIPFEQMAIFLQKPGKYGKIFREVFDSIQIPCYYHEGYPPDVTPEGKSLKLLLNLIKSGLPRFEVMELVTMGLINFEELFPDTSPPVPAVWDRISRKAGIKEDPENWARKLKRYRSGLERKLSGAEDQSEREKIQLEMSEAQRLVEFINMLNHDLGEFPGRNSWTGFTEKLISLFRKYIREEKQTQNIVGIIERLNELDDLQEIVDIEDFRSSVRNLLESNLLHPGRFMKGCVHIFNFRAAPGMTFDAIFIPGLVAGEIPSPPEENPLLLDREKEIFNEIFDWEGRLPLKSRLVDEEPILLNMLVGCCKKKLIFTFPRTAQGKNASNVPSPYILEIGKALLNKDVFYRDIDNIPGFVSIPRRFHRIFEQGLFLDTGEYFQGEISRAKEKNDFTVIQALEKSSDRFSSAMEFYKNRNYSNDFTRYDGRILTPDILQNLDKWLKENVATASPTYIETYYKCPYKFFLSRIIGLRSLSAPEEIKVISGLDRGNIYHDIFYRFYKKLRDSGLVPLDEDRRDKYISIIRDITQKTIEEALDSGLTGSCLSWFEEMVNIRDSMTKFVDEEIAGNEGIPTYFEFGFGRRKKSGSDSVGIENPVAIELENGVKFNYYGRIDRVDIDEEKGICTVIDYKSGKAKHYKPDTLRGGEQLQLPMYLISLKEILPAVSDHINSKALYYFATNGGDFKKVEFTGVTLAEKENEIKILISEMLRGVYDGIFIPNPGKNCENCRICDFNTICPVDIGKVFLKKCNDPDIKWFLELKEME
ncbi:MAG: PD-(D/E)XK nuclease family protein [Candidatus Eremiobacteraeota bacterium]|nr:PD-(D/E)XK nuclease family protein [Candidatus Eremiobacteraeota bacterium]